jgi:hypothetical protein
MLPQVKELACVMVVTSRYGPFNGPQRMGRNTRDFQQPPQAWDSFLEHSFQEEVALLIPWFRLLAFRTAKEYLFVVLSHTA